MMKCVVIDDEESCRELLKDQLRLYGNSVQVTAEAASVSAGYDAILAQGPDLVFLDVQMEDGTGFDLLKKFNAPSFQVIFTTAHLEYAVDAFRFSAVDYLLKPVSLEYLFSALRKAEERAGREEQQQLLKTLLENIAQPAKSRQKLVLRTMERIYTLDVSDILRFESEGSYTRVYIKDDKPIIVSRIIKEFDEMLSDRGFIRLHQSHLVNTDYLFYFDKGDNMLVMKDHSKIPVSVRKKDQLLQLLNQQ